MAITGVITGSSTEKLYQELGLEFLQNTRWFRKLYVFYKTVKEQNPKYLFGSIPSNSNSYQTRNSQNLLIYQFKVKSNLFLNSFFPTALVEWNKLDSGVRKSPSYSALKKKILNFTRPHSKDVFDVSHPKGLIFLIRLHEKTISLNSFLDTFHLICIWGFDIETLNYFFLHCLRSTNERQSLLLKIERIIADIFRKTDSSITSILLYGDPRFSAEHNNNILNSLFDYILSTNRFNLYLNLHSFCFLA